MERKNVCLRGSRARKASEDVEKEEKKAIEREGLKQCGGLGSMDICAGKKSSLKPRPET